MSPIRVILFPDKTKKRVRKESSYLLNATNQTSAETTCPTVEPLYMLPIILAYRTLFDKIFRLLACIRWGLFWCLHIGEILLKCCG